jgi:hypothetical protein
MPHFVPNPRAMSTRSLRISHGTWRRCAAGFALALLAIGTACQAGEAAPLDVEPATPPAAAAEAADNRSNGWIVVTPHSDIAHAPGFAGAPEPGFWGLSEGPGDASSAIVTLAGPSETDGSEFGRSQAKGSYTLGKLGRDIGRVKWELAGVAVAFAATRVPTIVKEPRGFYFVNEGWFGKDTESLGMDKLHHAYKTYVLQTLIARRTGEKDAATWSGAIVSFGMFAYAELLDAFADGHGWSNEDMVMHLGGAGFSLARNLVPGLRDKLDFRMEMRPSFKGDWWRLNNQLDDRKYLFAAKLAGWDALRDTPLRFVELHAGYYARGFSDLERERGDPLRRKIYFGIGLNVQQLLFGREKREKFIGRVARGLFDYIQVPYVYQEIN